jgi:hypothetical protein
MCGPAEEELEGCPVEKWGGPYLYRCGLGDSVLECAYHGPFKRAMRCSLVNMCRRPAGHGGRCD